MTTTRTAIPMKCDKCGKSTYFHATGYGNYKCGCKCHQR